MIYEVFDMMLHTTWINTFSGLFSLNRHRENRGHRLLRLDLPLCVLSGDVAASLSYLTIQFAAHSAQNQLRNSNSTGLTFG